MVNLISLCCFSPVECPMDGLSQLDLCRWESLHRVLIIIKVAVMISLPFSSSVEGQKPSHSHRSVEDCDIQTWVHSLFLLLLLLLSAQSNINNFQTIIHLKIVARIFVQSGPQNEFIKAMFIRLLLSNQSIV